MTFPQEGQQLLATDLLLLELQLEGVLGGQQDVEAGDVAQGEGEVLDVVVGDVQLVQFLQLVDVAGQESDLVVTQIQLSQLPQAAERGGDFFQ